MEYTSYLKINELLSCQVPVTNSENELMFMTIHQVSELWMKLLIKELRAARDAMSNNNISLSHCKLSRVTDITKQLLNTWKAWKTFAKEAYFEFRDHLQGASGFQSEQYQWVDHLLGHPRDFNEFSVRDEFIKLVNRTSDHTIETFQQAWLFVATHKEHQQGLYLVATQLKAIDDCFYLWRANHANTAKRLIDDLPGTVNTSGVAYLKAKVDKRYYPELVE